RGPAAFEWPSAAIRPARRPDEDLVPPDVSSFYPERPTSTGQPNICGILSEIFGAIAAGLLFIPCVWVISPAFGVAGLVLGIVGLSHRARSSAILGIVLSGIALFVSLLLFANIGQTLRDIRR